MSMKWKAKLSLNTQTIETKNKPEMILLILCKCNIMEKQENLNW